MGRRFFYLILLVLLSATLLSLYNMGLFKITGFFVGFGQPSGDYIWWNTSWHYRIRLELNSSQYSRLDWPIEYELNFTDLFPSGTFDSNSVRVVEYNSSGSILYEIPSQFDKGTDYDAAVNSVGTLVFLLNGSTPSNTKRYFLVYYDTLENGGKSDTNYATDLIYGNDTLGSNGEFSINNTYYKLVFDTIRGENTSGFHYAESGPQLYIDDLGEADKTFEYLEYSNGTSNFMFDFRNKANFLSTGPIRIVVEQTGNESFWDEPDSITGKGTMTKRYIFYKDNSWIKVVQNFTNIDSSNVTRRSTSAGALAFDASRAWAGGYRFGIGTDQENQVNPSDNTWGWASSSPVSNGIVGIININQTGTTNFWLANSSSLGRIGIQLNSTNITAGGSVTQTSAFYFNGSWYPNSIVNIKYRFADPVNINQSLPERWYVVIGTYINSTIFNRNEAFLISGNISSTDPYNLTEYINATLDMGTVSQADDQTIILHDDGTNGDSNADDKVFTNSFNISNSDVTGIWTINFTAYSNNSEFLNSTALNLDVTDVLNVTVNVLNKKPIVNSIVVANLHVKNYRQDFWIAGSTIDCSYDSTTVLNKTDYGNGTYSVNFSIPGQEQYYVLSCNATKDGNFGNSSDAFTSEPSKTYFNLTSQPSNPIVSNVSLYYGDSFALAANASNYGNGTAYSTNISLELINGWSANNTLEQCGDLDKSSYCLKGFQITLPGATSPGSYYINLTVAWRNPDSTVSSNQTQLNVTVNPNPMVDVEESVVSGNAEDGIWTIIGNFTVSSVGNNPLNNITFSCVSGDACSNFAVNFIPENIPSLDAGSKQNVSINVSVPVGYSPGTYTGTINASTQNDGFDNFTLEVKISSVTNVSIVTSITNYITYSITQQNDESFTFGSNATNIGNGSARYTNISLSLPSSWTSNSSLENCGNLSKGDICSKAFNVTIPKGTLPGNYLVNASANWTNNDYSMGTNKTWINVSVSLNPLINVSESNVTGTVSDGAEAAIGNFTVLSIGNDALQNINFSCYSGMVCQNFTVEFIPSTIASLPISSNQSVMVNITVPVGFPAGNHNGSVNVSAANDNYKNLTLEVNVPSNRTWNLTPDYCEKSQTPTEGEVCKINVTNYGNTYINFTVSPAQGNYTNVNETNFTVGYKSYHVFSITYNVTGISPNIYNSTFTVDAVESAIPDNRFVKVSLLPFVDPIVDVKITPNETEQQGSVEIFVNVTDRSGTNITWTRVNITRPNGTIDQFNMTKTGENGNLTTWYLQYPSTSGNTILRGIYPVSIHAKDNVGNTGEEEMSFLIYSKLVVSSSTFSNTYYQGDTGSIYYIVKDVSGSNVPNVSVIFAILDSNQNITYLTTETSNQEGTITPLPTFSLAADAPLGNYTLVSNSSFFDNTTNKTIEVQKTSSFLTLSRTVTVTGLFADVETTVIWYPPVAGSESPEVKFGILTYNGEGRPVDPDSINLTVYRPDNLLYFTDTMSNMQKLATGYYIYERAMSTDTPTGMYLAVVNATQDQFQTLKIKAFRIASGGPYDLWVNLFENEVQQGDYLDFEAQMENKGEVSQDVYLEWWVAAENGTRYYQESGWVRTPSLSNVSVTKRAYIFSNQPLGTNILNVKMTFDPTQPPLVANATFNVITNLQYPNMTLPTLPPIIIYATAAAPILALPTPKVTEKLAADISITNYRSNISLSKGMTKIESVIVKNIGKVNLNNVSFFIFGIPLTWFSITPDNYRTLPPDNSSVFLINFDIPANAKLGDYPITLTAASGLVSDQKYATITVYESIEDVLRSEINRTRADMQKLEEDVRKAQLEGKDVTNVLLYVDEIKTQMVLAESNLESGDTEGALSNISNAKNLLDRARNELDKIETLKVGEFGFSIWIIIIIAIAAAACVVVIFVLRKKKMIPPLRPYIIPTGKIVEKVKVKEEVKEDFAKEREKLMRMLEVLEKERSEGIISTVAYKEMKKSLEEKLSKIEKKMK